MTAVKVTPPTPMEFEEFYERMFKCAARLEKSCERISYSTNDIIEKGEEEKANIELLKRYYSSVDAKNVSKITLFTSIGLVVTVMAFLCSLSSWFIYDYLCDHELRKQHEITHNLEMQKEDLASKDLLLNDLSNKLVIKEKSLANEEKSLDIRDQKLTKREYAISSNSVVQNGCVYSNDCSEYEMLIEVLERNAITLNSNQLILPKSLTKQARVDKFGNGVIDLR